MEIANGRIFWKTLSLLWCQWWTQTALFTEIQEQTSKVMISTDCGNSIKMAPSWVLKQMLSTIIFWLCKDNMSLSTRLTSIHTVKNMVVLSTLVKIVKFQSCLLFTSHKNTLNVFTQSVKLILPQIKSALSGVKCIIDLESRTHLPFKPHFMALGKIKLTQIQNLFLSNFKILKILLLPFFMLWKKHKKQKQNLKIKN